MRDFQNVALIQTERDKGIDDLLDQSLVNGLAISLSLDKSENSARKLLVLRLDVEEELRFPLNQSELEERESV